MPLTTHQALAYFRSDDLIGLGMEADAVRSRLHPEGVVTYILDSEIRYARSAGTQGGPAGSNRPPSNELPRQRTLDFEPIYRQIAEMAEMGGTGLHLEGDLEAEPDLKINCIERLLQEIRRRFPHVSLDCFSAPEILAIAARSDLSVGDTVARLRDAGLDSIPGGGAGILGDDKRRRAAGECLTEDWLNVHRTAHRLGMRTTAAMTFGRGESFEQRIHHFDEIRRLQEETGGFAAFFPSNFQPGSAGPSAQMEGGNEEEATAVEYLKVLAIARLYLHTIENMQCSAAAQGVKVLQLTLRFGGNDAGPVVTVDRSIQGAEASQGAGASRSTTPSHLTTEEQLRQVIRGAGFMPVRRDTLYTTCFLN